MRPGSGSATSRMMSRIFCFLLPRGLFRVKAQHLVDLVAAAHHRIERRHRLLEDHRHARGAQLSQPRLAACGDFLAFEPDRAGGQRQRLRQQTHHALADHRFSGAGFAHQADDLAGRDAERHARDCLGALGACRQRDERSRTSRTLIPSWPFSGRACRAGRRPGYSPPAP